MNRPIRTNRTRSAHRRFVLFYHSLVSDWNHGAAHFLRGIVAELKARGHDVAVYEPRGGWSRSNLVAEHGPGAIWSFRRVFPDLRSRLYKPGELDLDDALGNADVVLVHEWNEPDLVARIGAHRRSGGRYRLLFHDTHHRCVSNPAEMASYDLSGYDGVLAFGWAVRNTYLSRGWARRVWTWHEAADTRVFRPIHPDRVDGDVVWIGNWADDERTEELHEFLIRPVRDLGLRARVYGVRFPPPARRALERAGIEYAGWIPNHRIPQAVSRFRLTIHVPRHYYVDQLPGIPTIRVFEAMACGVPLVSAPWNDVEGLFDPGFDFLMARDGQQMRWALRSLLTHEELARAMAKRGLATIQRRHTCAHRVDELMAILSELESPPATSTATLIEAGTGAHR